jgi:predicted ferric reductase
VKTLGDYTKSLAALRPGTVAVVEGAYGKFSYKNYRNPNQIWIAGGIGITPFLGMAESLGTEEHTIDLYYAVKHESELVDLGELLRIGEWQYHKFRTIPVVNDKDGLITAKLVNEKSGGVEGKDIFLCGPPGMMKNLRSQFRDLGVANSKIHSEEFSIL